MVCNTKIARNYINYLNLAQKKTPHGQVGSD